MNPVSVGAGNVKVYLTVSHQQAANELAQTANKEYEFFTDNFGAPETSHLNVVEIPDDTLPAIWGPELAGIMASRLFTRSGPNGRTVAVFPFLCVKRQVSGVTV